MSVEDFFQKIKKNHYSKLNPPLDKKQVILLQKELNDNELAALPESLMRILYVSNGISCNSSRVFGVSWDEPLNDLVSQNIGFNADKESLIAGASEMDLLVYKPQKKTYQILDRDDMEVLEEYGEDDLLKAVSVFLKISNE